MAGRLQVILSTIEPGGGTGAEPDTDDSDVEVVAALRGVLDLWVSDEHYALDEGRLRDHLSLAPPRIGTANDGDESATVLFCLTPPSF